jgi:hypothetical protein
MAGVSTGNFSKHKREAAFSTENGKLFATWTWEPRKNWLGRHRLPYFPAFLGYGFFLQYLLPPPWLFARLTTYCSLTILGAHDNLLF